MRSKLTDQQGKDYCSQKCLNVQNKINVVTATAQQPTTTSTPTPPPTSKKKSSSNNSFYDNFSWPEYLAKTGATPAPPTFFKQVVSFKKNHCCLATDTQVIFCSPPRRRRQTSQSVRSWRRLTLATRRPTA
jgi:hypothetical protein